VPVLTGAQDAITTMIEIQVRKYRVKLFSLYFFDSFFILRSIREIF